MAELGFKSRQSSFRALNDDAILPLKRLKTLIYYNRMPGHRRIKPYRFLGGGGGGEETNKQKKEEEKEKKEERRRKRRKAHLNQQTHPAEPSLDWINPTEI